MRIGIDIHHLRLVKRGIYYYIWNLVDWLGRIEHPHEVTLFLYGHPGLDDAAELRRWKEMFPRVDLCHYWDGPTPRLLSGSNGSNGVRGLLDRHVLLPLWRQAVRLAHRYPNKSRVLTWPWQDRSPSRKVDLFHHAGGLLYPPHSQANVLTLHDLIPHHTPDYNPSATEWYGEGIQHARHMDAVLTYSEHTKQDAIEALGVAEEIIHPVPLAAHEQYRPIDDRAAIDAVRARYGLNEHPYILYMGALEERKNLVRLTEAFDLLKREAPTLEHWLVLVGEGLMTQRIAETAARLGRGLEVRCLGFVPLEDLPPLMNGADLFAFVSLYEGFGLPPLEAMACGTPVVASNTTSLPEVVGDAGILVDPCQVEDIAAALHRVLTEPGLRPALRARGLARARQFTWERTARSTLAAYEAAWERARRNGRQGRPGRLRQTRLGAKLRQWVIEQSLR